VGPGPTLGAEEVIARRWLDLPDGLALSHDGRWLAISNHNSHSVLVYGYPISGDGADPVAILRGALYPHGLRFTADDRYLLVADAGGPYAHAFASPPEGWQGARYADGRIRVMDDETFRRGQYTSREGGPKGVDLHPAANVLAVTAECLPLAFFDLDAALEQPAAPSEDALLQYELDVMAENEALRVAAAEDRAQLDATGLKVELLRNSLDRLV